MHRWESGLIWHLELTPSWYDENKFWLRNGLTKNEPPKLLKSTNDHTYLYSVDSQTHCKACGTNSKHFLWIECKSEVCHSFVLHFESFDEQDASSSCRVFLIWEAKWQDGKLLQKGMFGILTPCTFFSNFLENNSGNGFPLAKYFWPNRAILQFLLCTVETPTNFNQCRTCHRVMHDLCDEKEYEIFSPTGKFGNPAYYDSW
jgi:hypothetical protein